MIWFALLWFYGISTMVGNLMLNPLHKYISNINDLVEFYVISAMVGYLMPNTLNKHMLNIYDLVRFGLVWFGLVLWHIKHDRLLNADSSL